MYHGSVPHQPWRNISSAVGGLATPPSGREILYTSDAESILGQDIGLPCWSGRDFGTVTVWL